MPDGQVDYKGELEKLPPEEREAYTTRWRDYLGGLSKGAYIGQLTKLTRQFGPEFTSGLIQPELVTERPEAPSIGRLPALDIEPEIPWYQKPIKWAAETTIGKPIFKGLETYHKGWITPAAMTIAQTYAPKMREEMAGRGAFAIPVEERQRMWEEADIPWLAKIAPELAIDPMMYFGWGLGTKAVMAAEKAGMRGVAQAIKPMATLEEAYIKAAAKPIRALGKGLQRIPEIPLGTWAGKPRAIGALFKESPRSMVNNEPLHVFDLLRNIDAAGGQLGKPLSSILQDIRMGIIDPKIAATITNPKQQAVLNRLIQHRDKLDLDVIAKVIDSFPERAAVVLARKETALLAKELGRVVPHKQLTAIALSKDMYGIWKRTVLSTPWYVEQNIVENFIRPVMVGANPIKDINAIVASPIFKRWPIDMQRRALTFAQRWNQNIPENLKWARSVATGGLTESMSGALATGKKWPTLTAGATLDEQAMLRTFDYMYEQFERQLMKNTSKQTAKALADMTALYDNAGARASFLDWSTVKFSGEYDVVLRSKVKSWVDKLPLDVKSEIRGFDIWPTLTADARSRGIKIPEGFRVAANRSYAGQISFETLDDVTEATLYHEIAHGISNDLMAKSLMAERGAVNILREYDGLVKMLDPELMLESFSDDFAIYLTTGKLPSAKLELFTKYYPKVDVEPPLLAHLKSTGISGSTDDVLAAFAEVQRNKTMTIARAITQAEKGLPDAIRSGIQKELPRAWAQNDIHAIERMFEKYQLSLPDQIRTYQKQALLQRLSYFKKLVKQEVPQKYQPLYNQILNRFKYERVADREARLTAAKSLSEFESAMFNANLESAREMESLILGNVIAESIGTRQYSKIATYLGIHEQIVQAAFRAGDELTERTFTMSKVISYAKDPKKIQQGWDEYIMRIQSEFPDQAAILQASAPDADLLWSTRRAIQDRRWFKVSQDELAAMQMDPGKFPRMVDAQGKLLTMEDYMGKQTTALRSWKDRAVAAFAKRHEVPVTTIPFQPTRFPVSGTDATMATYRLDRHRIATLYLADIKGKVDQKMLREAAEDLVHKLEFETPRIPDFQGLKAASVLQEPDFLKLKGLVDSGADIKMVDFDAVMGIIHDFPEGWRAAERIVEGGIDTFETLFAGKEKVIKSWIKAPTKVTTKNQLLDNLRDETIRIKEGVGLQELKLQNEAMDLALDVSYETFGNYGVRTNLDDIMQGIGMPFWFFPSRSIPFYARQMIQKPKLGTEIMTLQSQAEESNLPTRLFGFLPILGTDYFYNPLAASMLWQLAGQYDWTPQHLGGLEQGQLQMQQKLGMSFGPQWMIATALVSRLMVKQGGRPLVVGEPKYVIPQHRWLEAVENLDLPGLSQIAGIISEPFDAYLRAVFGSEVAEWQKREVEKYIVDMGHNPQDASKEVIQDAWKKYWTRQLLSIPGGVVKEMTPTEKARFEVMGEKAKEMGLTRKQTAELRAAGESPWTGLRQDQLEVLFADIPAQKLNRYIRPIGLTSESRPVWEDYIQLKVERETLRGNPDNPAKGSRIYKEMELDVALRAGRISPREWKSLYRQNYANYVSQIEALERAYPQAPKTEQDWEAYRDLLGWDEPVRHPDDIKLDEYYTAMESSQFENDLGEFDYDAYRKAEQQFLSGLSPDTIAYIKSRKDRYKTPLRAAYTRDMEKVQPYYDLQDSILKQYPPEIAVVIEYALASPDPAIQRAILINHPGAMIALRKIRVAKKRLRMQNPEMDKILRYWSS